MIISNSWNRLSWKTFDAYCSGK